MPIKCDSQWAKSVCAFVLLGYFVWHPLVWAEPTTVPTMPVFDMHMHYKWSQKEVTSPQEAIRLMDAAGIDKAMVMGKPAELALTLKEQSPERIIAVFSPYRGGMDWFRWQRDETVVERARAALKSGDYAGIGELHIIGGFTPKRAENSTLPALMDLAAEYDVPIMLHTEFSNPQYMLTICEAHPETKVVWAHSGSILEPADVDKVMTACPNVWGGMGARDPWRFVGNPHTDESGTLLPAWRDLFLKYPHRFMVGSDTVWPVDQMDRWDEPDTGWQELGRFWTFHRSWLAQLPEDVAAKLARENAAALFTSQAKTTKMAP